MFSSSALNRSTPNVAFCTIETGSHTWKKIDQVHDTRRLFLRCTTILGALFGPNPSPLGTRPPGRNIDKNRLRVKINCDRYFITKLCKFLSGNMNTQNTLRIVVGVMNRLAYFRSAHNTRSCVLRRLISPSTYGGDSLRWKRCKYLNKKCKNPF